MFSHGWIPGVEANVACGSSKDLFTSECVCVCVHVHVHVGAHVCSGIHEGQKRTSNPLELELQAVVSL